MPDRNMGKVHHRTGAGARINADHIVLYRLIVAGILATAAAAIVTSWNGLIYVAAWQQLVPGLRWVTPVMIDVAIVVFTLGDLAKKSRGESAVLFIVGKYSLTAISSAANFAHTVSISGLGDFQAVTGACLNTIAPPLILLTTEVLGALITRPKRIPRKKSGRRTALKPRTIKVTALTAQPAPVEAFELGVRAGAALDGGTP